MVTNLFYRISNNLKFDQFASVEDAQQSLLNSIIKNLNTILNSMAGCCEIRPEYGLTDFNAVFQSHQDTAIKLCRDIENQIKMFEPRLYNSIVTIIDDPDRPLEFVFNIEAQLFYKNKKMKIQICSVLDSNGKISIST